MQLSKIRQFTIPTVFLLIILMMLSGCLSMQKTPPEKLIKNSNHYSPPAPGNDLIGHTVLVQSRPGQKLSSIGRAYDVGITEMINANSEIKPNQLLLYSTITVPIQYVLPPKKYRKGIVINVPELRLYYFAVDGTISTYPVSLGRKKWRTPLGATQVLRKKAGPTWTVPASIKAEALKNGKELPDQIPPGPGNPLGPYAIYLDMPGYLIHGTTNPDSIGKFVSSGCVRMFNKDITDLFARVQKGDPVNIIYYPNKVGWLNNTLYLESHKLVNHDEADVAYKEISVKSAIMEVTKERLNTQINWKRVDKILAEHTGTPLNIGHS